MPPVFECVVFDMDGVLADTTPCHAQAYAELWGEIGVQGPDYAGLAGLSTPDAIRRVLGDGVLDDEEIDRWTERKRQRARDLIRASDIVFPDAAALVNDLRRLGLPMAVATGASRATADLVIGGAGFGGAFRDVVSVEDVALGKPHPDVMQRAIEACGADPAKTLVIEDGLSGIEAAFAAGAWAAGVRQPFDLEHERFLGAFRTLHSLRTSAVFQAP